MKILLLMLAAIIFAGCQHNAESGSVNQMHEFTQDTKVIDVINYKNFGGFGRLIFPTRGIDKNLTLKNLDEVFIWYSEVNPKKTVEIVNYMREKSDAGEKIFYDIYKAEERLSDPRKNNMGLFFFAASRTRNLQFAMRAEVFTTSERCTTAFRTRWSCPNAATMPSR